MIFSVLQVALGGALGASARYLLGLMVAFPFGTLTVNAVGSLLMGVAYVSLTQKGLDKWSLFLMTGFLGGFTTFSAFSLDTLKLVDAEKLSAASMYVIASVVLSLGGLYAGVVLTKAVQG